MSDTTSPNSQNGGTVRPIQNHALGPIFYLLGNEYSLLRQTGDSLIVFNKLIQFFQQGLRSALCLALTASLLVASIPAEALRLCGAPSTLSIQPSSVCSTANLVLSQAIIARLAGGRFLSGTGFGRESAVPFSRWARELKSKGNCQTAPRDLTPSRLRVRALHAWREFRGDLGGILRRQLVVAVLNFLTAYNLHKLKDPMMILVIQWGFASASVSLFWAGKRLFAEADGSSARAAPLSSPSPAVNHREDRPWYEKLEWLPFPVFALAMAAANIGSQLGGIISVNSAGPVTSAAADQSKGLFLLLAGVFLFKENRFLKSGLFLTCWFLAAGLIQPLIAWWGGAPLSLVGIGAGFASALCGATLSVGFKIQFYRFRGVDPRIISYLGIVATTAFAFVWLWASHAWNWDVTMHQFGMVPWGVYFCCLIYGLAKFNQYAFNAGVTQRKDLAQMAWGSYFSLPIHIAVNAAGRPLMDKLRPVLASIFGSFEWEFPEQKMGFWSAVVPLIIDTAGIVKALAQVDRPGLRSLISERVSAVEFVRGQRGLVGISGSAYAQKGPYAVLAAEVGIALQRHGLRTLDAGGPGLPQSVREAYVFARQQAGVELSPETAIMSVSANIRFRDDIAPSVDSIIRVNHSNARKVAQARGTLGQIVFPGSFGVWDETLEMIELGRPVVLMEAEGDDYWESMFGALSLRLGEHVVIARSGEEAVLALLRLAERFPAAVPEDWSKANRDLETPWLEMDRSNWPKAFVLTGRPVPEDRAAAESLAAELLKRRQDVRLAGRGDALWTPVLKAAKRLGAQSYLQAVLHLSPGETPSKAEQKILPEQKIILESKSNHQVLFARKDNGFVFFFERGPKAVHTLNMLFDLVVQMQLGKMNEVPLVLYGDSWTAFAQLFLEKTGQKMRPEDARFLTIARSVPEALALLGIHAESLDSEVPPSSVMLKRGWPRRIRGIFDKRVRSSV